MDETTLPEDFNPPLSPTERFGNDVRRVRLGRKLTQRHLGTAIGYSESYVSQVESGKISASERFAEGCDRVFGTNGLFAGMLHLAEQGDHPAQFVPYLQLEPKASRIMDFSATTILGVLQTRGYAHAIFRAGHPHETEEVIEGKVAARLERRAILSRNRPPKLWAVLHEACLRTHVGGDRVMLDQLKHLLTSAESPSVDVQVLPYTAGAAAAHSGPITLLAFANEPTVLYAGDPQGGRLYRTLATVEAAMDAFHRLRAHALDPDHSLSVIRTLCREYERDE